MHSNKSLVLLIVLFLQISTLSAMKVDEDDLRDDANFTHEADVKQNPQEHCALANKIEQEEWQTAQSQAKKWLYPGVCGLALTFCYHLSTKSHDHKIFGLSARTRTKTGAGLSAAVFAVGFGFLSSKSTAGKKITDSIAHISGKAKNKPTSYVKWSKKYKESQGSLTADERTFFQLSLPLHQAVYDGNITMIDTLICSGENINKIDASGYSALYHAIDLDRLDFANSLVDAGANLTIVGNYEGMAEIDALYATVSRALPNVLHGNMSHLDDYIAFMKKLREKGVAGKRRSLCCESDVTTAVGILDSLETKAKNFQLGSDEDRLWPVRGYTMKIEGGRVIGEKIITKPQQLVRLQAKAATIIARIRREVFEDKKEA